MHSIFNTFVRNFLTPMSFPNTAFAVGTGFATEELEDGAMVTLCCDGSATGRVYEGKLEFTKKVTDLSEIPTTKTNINLNLADPDSVFRWWKLPIDGIGLARMEFTVTEHVKAHPMALAHPEMISDPEVLWQIEELTKRFETPADYMVDTLARGLACLSAMCYPKPVIVRMSDFKTNEYATLLGGADFEPDEENPMVSFTCIPISSSLADHSRSNFPQFCLHRLCLAFCRLASAEPRVITIPVIAMVSSSNVRRSRWCGRRWELRI